MRAVARVAPHRRETSRSVRFSLTGTVRRLRAPQAEKERPLVSGERTLPSRSMQGLTCASNINSKPRRDGSAERNRDFARCRRCGARPFSSFAAANVRRAQSRSSSSPQALAELCVAPNAVFVEDMIGGLNMVPTNVVALRRIESSVCQAPGSFKGANLGARAGGRHADTAGTFHRQHALHKAAGSELASRLWDLPAGEAGFVLITRAFHQ